MALSGCIMGAGPESAARSSVSALVRLATARAVGAWLGAAAFDFAQLAKIASISYARTDGPGFHFFFGGLTKLSS